MTPDPSRLSSRLRELLKGSPAAAGTRDSAEPLDGGAAAPGHRELTYEADDGMAIRGSAGGGCVVVERHYDLQVPHGRHAVAQYGEALGRCLPALAVLAVDERAAAASREARTTRLQWDADRRHADERQRIGVPTTGPLLFFDLETTGLSGGAGTLAFLVGCGFFDADGFHTRQLFLSGYEAERELLDALVALTGRFSGLVTFNGRTFDVPLIETRYLFHRLESPFAAMPHFDMLHPARRLWRRRSIGQPSHRDRWTDGRPGDGASCALGALEEAILGVQRFDDVPGSEIPSRYFNYLRTGDLAPLTAVFEHNRLDLLSLAALTAIAAQMADEGPSGAASPHEALAMGRIYERLGRWSDADACFSRAAGLGDAPWDPRSVERDIRADALRHLALERRRQRRYEDAAEAWNHLLDSGAGPAITQEAHRALAIHHEHRVRDLEAARRFALEALGAEDDAAERAALQHRLSRLDRKLQRANARWMEGT